MGRRFAQELGELDRTYEWSRTISCDSLTSFAKAAVASPLVAVGSGGSFSVAQLACDLHQHYSGQIAKAMTPLEALSSALNLRSLAVLVLSAGGTNTDILSAFQEAALREPRRIGVLCLRPASPLATLAASYSFVDSVELTPPTFRDGFLATNSLLASSVLLTRAYADIFTPEYELPHDLASTLSPRRPLADSIGNLREITAPLWEHETTIVLYGPDLKAAAIDIESKFSEAALGNIQLADFRNFGHGRHTWLAKRGDRTGILVLHSLQERQLADRTLALIPKSVPIARIEIPHSGPVANLGGLVAVMHIVAAAGECRGIDPGRPGVPAFGRRLYNIRPSRPPAARSSLRDVSIARKLASSASSITPAQEWTIWQRARSEFVQSFSDVRFGAIAFDYDGTLCSEAHRFLELDPEVGAQLKELACQGITIGIATGRGRSAREALRKAIPAQLWPQFWVGYYNGAEIASLTENLMPVQAASVEPAISNAAPAISQHTLLSRLAAFEVRRTQISVMPHEASWTERVWKLLEPIADSFQLRLVRSTHSIDMLLPDVSKQALLHHLEGRVAPGLSVLAIGDRGNFTGNDYQLLRSKYSLSVDEVSPVLESCWNLAPAGLRGVPATLWYLQGITVGFGEIAVNPQYFRSHSRRSQNS